ncbi:MAG: exodeoxyribonuclease VII small subunit [Candidatus Baltobacteraceae bacterium]
MATKESGEFEKALTRLEAIVVALERQETTLDESVGLYREGTALAKRCDDLLREAKAALEAAASGVPRAATESREHANLFADHEDGELSL